MLEKRGAVVLRAPALAEEPDVDLPALRRLVDDWVARPFSLVIFQTGVGTRALFDAADRLGITEKLSSLLSQTLVAVRGPKPTAALRSRSVRIDLSAQDPFTTREVLASLHGIDLIGKHVLVQRYGDSNVGLDEGLQQLGASVTEVPLYRWALPADLEPLRNLIDALAKHEVDAAVFTSASQVRNLFAVASHGGGADRLRDDLNAVLIASIGPVCSAALKDAGLRIGVEASPPKLGPLVDALERSLG
ncbi:MAG TPA: uroporphyrinogen-III synthase [Burkholderiales bacterium]|nr:uroporphyrinogen-III synthase [Burkholderiales bacterium]